MSSRRRPGSRPRSMTHRRDPGLRRDDDKRLPQPRFEILVTEFADQLQFVALAVPQPDRRQRHTVEAVRLHHRIMRLVEEGEALADPRAAGEAIVADDVAGEARRAAEPRGPSVAALTEHRRATGGTEAG